MTSHINNIKNCTNSTDLTSVSNHTSGYKHKALSVESIVCKVFSYLDLRSLSNCSRVNNQWLQDSHHPSSIYHINIETLFYVHISDYIVSPWFDGSKEKKMEQKRRLTANLTRFTHVRSVSTGNLIVFSHQLRNPIPLNFVEILTRVKKLDIVDFVKKNCVFQSFVDSTMNLLYQNKNHLESIRISKTSLASHLPTINTTSSSQSPIFTSKDNPAWTYICDNIKQFNKLEKIEIFCCDVRSSQSLILFPDITLKILKLTGSSQYKMRFWQSIIANEENLGNLEQFTLEMPLVEKVNADLFKNKIIPNLCARIMRKNLKWIQLYEPHLDYFRYNYAMNISNRNDYEPAEFFGVHFLRYIVLSMKKLGFFNFNKKNGDNNIKFKCCIDVLDECNGTDLSVKLFKISDSNNSNNNNNNVSELQELSIFLHYNVNQFRDLPIEMLNSITQVDMTLRESCVLNHVDQLLDLLCFNKDCDFQLEEKKQEKTKNTKKKQSHKNYVYKKIGTAKINGYASVASNNNNDNNNVFATQSQTIPIVNMYFNKSKEYKWPSSFDTLFSCEQKNECASIQCDGNNRSTITTTTTTTTHVNTKELDQIGSDGFDIDCLDHNDNNSDNIDISKRISNIEKLTINGSGKITTDFIFDALSELQFKNDCLQYIKLFGLKSNENGNYNGNQFQRAFTESVKFFKANINVSIDITLSTTLILLNDYVSQLISLFLRMHNDLLLQDCNKNPFRICILTNATCGSRDAKAKANGNGIEWLDTLLNGFSKLSSCMNINSKHDDDIFKYNDKKNDVDGKGITECEVNFKKDINGGVVKINIRTSENVSSNSKSNVARKMQVQIEFIMYPNLA